MAAPQIQAETPDIVYEGQLQDSKRKPLSGIFELTFKLYRSSRARNATWEESRFVAVDDGAYRVMLGSLRKLPANLPVERSYLGVSLAGGPEILREPLQVDSPEPAPRREVAPAADGGARTPTATPARTRPSAGTSVKYAEEAGFAFEAETAAVATSVGKLTEKGIRDLLKGAKTEINIGSSKRYSERIGGQGGEAYSVSCPKGYVVTGLRGGAAAFVDAITLICSPLE